MPIQTLLKESQSLRKSSQDFLNQKVNDSNPAYRDWETDRKSTRLNSSHITRSRMPSSA